MGQKVNPHGLRVGVNAGWSSQWYADKKSFAAFLKEDNEIMLITTEGVIIRIMCDQISELGRVTSGVKLMNIDKNSEVKVASIAKVRESNDAISEAQVLERLEAELEEGDSPL